MKKGARIIYIGEPEAVRRVNKKLGVNMPIPNKERLYTFGGRHHKGHSGILVDELPMPDPDKQAWDQSYWITLEDAICNLRAARNCMDRVDQERQPVPITAVVPDGSKKFTTKEDF